MRTEKRKEEFINVSFEISREFNEKIKQIAKNEDISKSSLIRRALYEYINE